MDIIPLIKKKKDLGGVYGVERCRNIADPSFPWLIGDPDRLAALPHHNLIRPCKSNEARQIVNFLKTTNWNKNADGTNSTLDGSDGLDVMLNYPGGWFIPGGTDPVYERYLVSDSYFTYGNDEAIEVKGYLDCPDYCTLDRTTGKARSIRNETANFAGSGAGQTSGGLGYSRTSISRYGYEAAAELKGAGWEGLSYIDLLYTATLMYIEYKTKNLKLYLEAGSSNWTSGNWNTYNGYNPVFKIFEAQLALSNTSPVNALGYMTGVYTKEFTIPITINTPKPVWRGKSRLWGDLWQWLSRIELEVQSVASGNKSFLYVGYPNVQADANRSDADFTFKNNYKLIGEVNRVDAYVRTMHKNTLAGANQTGAGETTFGCAHNWNSNLPASGVDRRGVRFGAPLNLGGICALASAASGYAPSYTYAYLGGGFRANVSG